MNVAFIRSKSTFHVKKVVHMINPKGKNGCQKEVQQKKVLQ
jgi:hypothetical protein